MWQWVFLTLCSLTALVAVVEEPRYQQCYATCSRRDYRNQLLLKSEVCKDDYTRSELDGDHVSCTRAQEEVTLGIMRCSVSKWWREGEPAALYRRVLGSSYMIYAILMPCLIFFIYQCFAYLNERRRENKWFEERHSFVQNVMQLQQETHQPPSSYSSSSSSSFLSSTPLRYVSRHGGDREGSEKRLTNWEMREQSRRRMFHKY